MSSSTSSSEPGWLSRVVGSIRRGEGRVVLCIVFCILLAEGAMRMFELRLSKDLAHIRSMPGVARQMREHEGEKLLFVGNSLTRCAIDAQIIRDALARKGARNPAVFFFTPDATSALNWDYGIQRYFLETEALPDQIFIGTGPHHLADRTIDDATRLGAFYVSASQITRAMREDVRGWEQKCEFFLARASILFTSRLKVKPRVFGPLIPHYFDMEQWVNQQRNPGARDAAPATATYRHLAVMMEDLRQAGVAAHVFTVPQPKPYDIGPEARRVIEAHGARLHDLAGIPGISAAHFADGYHLDLAGAGIFSQALAGSLQPAGGTQK